MKSIVIVWKAWILNQTPHKFALFCSLSDVRNADRFKQCISAKSNCSPLQGIWWQNVFFKLTIRIHYENIVNYLELLKCSHRSIICSKCIALKRSWYELNTHVEDTKSLNRALFISKKRSDEKLYFQITGASIAS